jgi:hypothetical protein
MVSWHISSTPKETESDFTLDFTINGVTKDTFRFGPQTILDQRKAVVPIADLKINELNITEFAKEEHNRLENPYYYGMSLKYFLPADQIAPRDEGFTIERNFYKLDDKKNENPLIRAAVGGVLRVNLKLTIPATRNHAIVEDFIPAGFEIVNLDLATEQKSLRLQDRELKDRQLRPEFCRAVDCEALENQWAGQMLCGSLRYGNGGRD